MGGTRRGARAGDHHRHPRGDLFTALGLATPLAEELTHHRLRRAGVFVRKPSFLEKALAVRRILLDKTGTLTMDAWCSTRPARRRWRPSARVIAPCCAT